MKRIAYIIIATLSALTMRAADLSNSIEYGQLYLIGPACSAGWNIDNALEFNKIAYGVFEWTGDLTAGEDFKFMNTREWHKHLVSTESGTVAQKGGTYALDFYADWSLSDDKDRKLKVATSGTYTIIVDITCMRMTLQEPAAAMPWPEKFYLVGSATDNQVIEVPNFYNVEFKKNVTLKPGNVKLMDTPTVTASTTYYVPRFDDVDVSFGKGYTSTMVSTSDANAAGWSVSVAGNYTFYLDESSHSYQCNLFKPRQVLYLVGGCCEKSWNYWDKSNCEFTPDASRPEVLVWDGELRIGWDGSIEPDRFKILTSKNWFGDTYHPYAQDTEAEGVTDARISGGDDNKWKITRDGAYHIEVNTLTEQVTCTYTGATSSPDLSGSESGISDVAADTEGETAYYNLQGVRIAEPTTGLYIKRQGSKAVKCIKR